MRINFEFFNRITNEPYTSNNSLIIDRDSIEFTNLRFIPSKITEIPLVLIPVLENAILKENDEVIKLRYLTNMQFRGRKLKSAQLAGIIGNLCECFKDCNSSLIFGKGFIAVNRGTYLEYLFMITTTVEKGVVEKNINKCKIYISPKLKSEFRTINSIIEKYFLKDFNGDIIITNAMSKYFGVKVKLPKFDTVAEQQDFIKQMFAQFVIQLAA
jgi:hypothetical protein